MTVAKVKPTERQQAMHQTHTEWREDHAAWSDEVEIWAGQYQRALADLARVEALIRDHGATLQEHGASLQSHERGLQAHERELVMLQDKGLGEQYDPQTPAHDAWLVQHARERELHTRLKAQHHELVVLVKKLVEAAVAISRGDLVT